jgi:hypothetical protein
VKLLKKKKTKIHNQLLGSKIYYDIFMYSTWPLSASSCIYELGRAYVASICERFFTVGYSENATKRKSPLSLSLKTVDIYL